MKIGFIGLGTMGASLSVNLIKAGHDLVVSDISRQAAERLIAAGAVWAPTPKAVAEQSDVIFTSLPGPPEVESVALGPDGLIEGVRPGSVLFDLSTNSPTTVRAVHAAFAERGAHVLDAPVSGGPRGAINGKLAIWVGGDADIYARHEPLLRIMGDQPRHVGAIGAGTVAKLVHNCAGYTVLCALTEVMTMGVKAGVEPLALWEALRQGVQGRRRVFDGLANQVMPNQFDPPDFALRLALKDVSLATAVGREMGVPMRLANLALAEMTEAVGRGWGHRDSRVVSLLQQQRAGVEIACDPADIKDVLERDGKPKTAPSKGGVGD